MAHLGDITAKLRLDTREFDLKSIASELKSLAGDIAGVGLGVTAFAGVFGVVAGAALDAGAEVNQAWREIAVRTGATGDALKGLQGDFKAVFAEVPESAKGVGETLAQLNQRLGLTGESLRELSTKEIELAHITKAELGTQVESTSKLFAQWGTSIKNPAEALDFLFGVSQKTGISVTKLSDELMGAGPVMRDFGISFEQGAAMLAQLDKEGLDSGKIVAGMSISFRKLVGDLHGDVMGAFGELTGRMRDASTAAEANTIAVQYFGRGAATMGEAVRSGKLDVEGLLKSLEQGGPGIMKTAEDVRTVGESFETLKNKVMGLLAPLGQDLISAMKDAGEGLNAFVDLYENDWAGLKTSVDATIKDITSFYHDHKTEIDLLAQGVGAALMLAAKFWADSAKDILDSIAVITLGMRVAAGDWGAAWQQYNEISAREQAKNKASAEAFAQWNVRTFAGMGLELEAAASATWGAISRVFVSTWESLKTQAENAWGAIKQAIIQPIQEALDWLQSKVRDFQTAFDAITNAARVGLQVHSPPIAAVWLNEIGTAAGVAADASMSSAPKFEGSFEAVSASAAMNLPKVSQHFQGMAGEILKVLADLGVKVPKVLQDIFGSVGGKGAGSAGVKSAKDYGSDLGNALVDSFGEALKGVQGIAAGQKQGGLLGRVEGALSGALAGAQIGSLFGPAGAAIGAGIGAIAGLFGSAPTALQKAQEAAALQQAKDAVRKSQEEVLQLVEQTKQSWLKTLDDARTLLESIQFYSKVPKLAFSQFFTDVNKLFENVVELAKAWKLDATADIKAAAENLKAGVEFVAALPAALEGISKYLGVPQSSIDRFFSDVTKLLDAFSATADQFTKAALKHISKFADLMKPAIDLWSSAVSSITGMFDLKDIPPANFDTVKNAINQIVLGIADLTNYFEKWVLKQVGFFGQTVAPAVDLWKNAIDAIKAMVDVPVPSAADFRNLFDSIKAALFQMSDLAAMMDTEMLLRAQAIAQAAMPIFDAIKTAVESLGALRDYKAVGSETFKLLLSDFGQALQMMVDMDALSARFITLAVIFEQNIQAGADHLKNAISIFQTAIKNLGFGLGAFGVSVTFPGGGDGDVGTTSASSPTGGGLAPSSMSGGGFAPSSRSGGGGFGPSAPAPAGNTTNYFQFGGLTVNGDDPRARALLEALADLFGPGTGLDQALSQYGS